MGLRINQNIAAMNSYRNLSVTDGQMSKSLEKLSSGFRINRAADDAAGLSISEGLRAQVGGLKVAVRNAQDGISVVQTAEGALNEVHSILQRMRDLAVQAASSGAQDESARHAAQLEVDELLSEIDRIGGTTKFGSSTLLDGNFGATASRLAGVITADDAVTDDGTGDVVGLVVAAGANTFSLTANGGAATDVSVAAGEYNNASEYEAAIRTGLTNAGIADNVDVEVRDLGDNLWKVTFTDSDGETLTMANGSANDGRAVLTGIAAAATDTGGAGTGGVFQVGANAGEVINVSIDGVDTGALVLGGVDLETDASAAIGLIDDAIAQISETRGKLGAFQNRFEHTIANLSVAAENLSASESRIRDTDMAQEMVNFTRSQILTQAGTAMLAQANQAPQQVLQLLR